MLPMPLACAATQAGAASAAASIVQAHAIKRTAGARTLLRRRARIQWTASAACMLPRWMPSEDDLTQMCSNAGGRTTRRWMGGLRFEREGEGEGGGLACCYCMHRGIVVETRGSSAVTAQGAAAGPVGPLATADTVAEHAEPR